MPSERISLALSGGGFRAAAFHLGVLKRLHELGLLDNLKTISTVSGGSIIGALYCRARSAGWSFDTFEKTAVTGMLAGLRSWMAIWVLAVPVVIALASVITLGLYSCGYLVSLAIAVTLITPWCWRILSPRLLVRQLNKKFFGGASLFDLASEPQLLINTTSLNSGTAFVISHRNRQGDYAYQWPRYREPVGWDVPWHRRSDDTELGVKTSMVFRSHIWNLAKATAASAAVPGILPPIQVYHCPVEYQKGPDEYANLKSEDGNINLSVPIPKVPRVPLVPRMIGLFTPRLVYGNAVLVDGGIFDNQAIDPWLTATYQEGPEFLIVSDCTRPLWGDALPSTFDLLPEIPVIGRLWGRQSVLRRCVAIMSDRQRKLNRDRIWGEEDCAYVEIDPSGTPYFWPKDSPYQLEQFRNQMGRIRTDLDGFSHEEISLLMFHGYTLIEWCLRYHRPQWFDENSSPLNFQVPTLNIKWGHEFPAELRRHYYRHLSASHLHYGIPRWLRRWLAASTHGSDGVTS